MIHDLKKRGPADFQAVKEIKLHGYYIGRRRRRKKRASAMKNQYSPTVPEPASRTCSLISFVYYSRPAKSGAWRARRGQLTAQGQAISAAEAVPCL